MLERVSELATDILDRNVHTYQFMGTFLLGLPIVFESPVRSGYLDPWCLTRLRPVCLHCGNGTILWRAEFLQNVLSDHKILHVAE